MSKQKYIKYVSTSLENLANELLIYIFGYLTDVDVVYSFSQLNIRFQNLILNYCRSFNFKSVNKIKFDLVLQQHDIKYWRSLFLSNDNDTPGQIELFCQRYRLEKHLTQLESIVFEKIDFNKSHIVLSQISSFIHLISLSIKSVCGEFISSINLPSLKRLRVTSCTYGKWIKNFSQLQILEHTIEDHPHHDRTQILDNLWPTQLTRLKVFYDEDKYGISIRNFLPRLSKLINLEICTESKSEPPPPDGQIWEELINSSLPLLETFKFCFTFIICFRINDMIASFSTPFYLSKKRWYISCDINHRRRIACLYSLPFAFQHFTVSTSSFNTRLRNLLNHDDRNMYKNVKTLIFNYPCEKPHPNFCPQNINELILNTSICVNNNWLSLLTGLCHLSLGHEITITSNEFNCLLKNTINLCYLTTETSILNRLTDDWNNPMICDILSTKIRKVNLDPRRDVYSKSRDYIKRKDLQNIIQIFGTNCEHLILCLKSHHIIETLILPFMQKLQSLSVSGIFDEFGRTFVMNSIDQWHISRKNTHHLSVDRHVLNIWFG